MTISTDTTIKAAMSVARDVAEGRLNPADLDVGLVDACRDLFGTVAGPADALWPLHVDVARQVLAVGGVSADELTEWAAVARLRAAQAAAASDPPNDPPEAASSTSGPLSPESLTGQSEDRP